MGCAASVTPVTSFTSPVPAVCKDSSASTAAPAPLFTVTVTWQEFSMKSSAHIDGDILTFLHLVRMKMKDFNIRVSEVLETAMKIFVTFI